MSKNIMSALWKKVSVDQIWKLGNQANINPHTISQDQTPIGASLFNTLTINISYSVVITALLTAPLTAPPFFFYWSRSWSDSDPFSSNDLSVLTLSPVEASHC